MKPNELSTEFIAFRLAELESLIDQNFAEKKELLKELHNRLDFYREQYRRGRIKMERPEDEINKGED